MHRLLRRFGYDIHRVHSTQGPLGPVIRLIQREAINLVFDVGANAGQFADSLRHHGYSGRMVSFEPVAEAHRELLNTAGGDSAWIVAPRMALGAEEGEIAMKVAALSGLSSVLQPSSSLVQAYPPSAAITTELVPCHRLDTVSQQYLRPGERALLKVDVQGFEKQVLQGSESLLQTLRGIYIEVSLASLYDGQALAPEILDYLNRRGFQIWYLSPGWLDPQSGRMLQYDVLLARDGTSSTARDQRWL